MGRQPPEEDEHASELRELDIRVATYAVLFELTSQRRDELFSVLSEAPDADSAIATIAAHFEVPAGAAHAVVDARSGILTRAGQARLRENLTAAEQGRAHLRGEPAAS